MTDHMYTLPVYRRVLQYAYMHKADWSPYQSKGTRWLQEHIPQIDLGATSGKTTAAVDYATSFVDVVLITATQDLADNIVRRNPTVRAFSRVHLDKLPPHNFQSTQPLFVFDDVSQKDTLEVLTKFKPERFVHLGAW